MRKNIIDEYYINLANSGIKIPKEILIKKAPDTIII